MTHPDPLAPRVTAADYAVARHALGLPHDHDAVRVLAYWLAGDLRDAV